MISNIFQHFQCFTMLLYNKLWIKIWKWTWPYDHLIYFRIFLRGMVNTWWLVLQLAWWGQWIEYYVQSSQSSGFNSWSSLDFQNLYYNYMYMTERVRTVYKLIWFTRTKLLAISNSRINMRLNCILIHTPHKPKLKTFPFQETSWFKVRFKFGCLDHLDLLHHFNLSTEKNKMLDKLYLPSDGLFMKPHFIPVGKPDKKLRS